MRKVTFAILLLAGAVSAVAQKRPVPPTESHYRVWAIDQVVTDAKTGARSPAHAAGMLGFACIYANDGKHALCEFVGKTYADHNPLRNAVAASAAADPLMKVWEKAATKRADFEAGAIAGGFKTEDIRKLSVSVH